MSSKGKTNVLFRSYEAFIFDMDGVITQTARMHAQSWKKMFDDFLEKRAGKTEAEPFDISSDYKVYVDGKPRYDGVRSFLQSRGIHLPYGRTHDSPEKETICGLGNRKNLIFLQLIEEKGVDVYSSSVKLINEIKSSDIKVAVISASKNCSAILSAAGIPDLFDVQVDGVVSEEIKLKGKPHPDIFLEAARRLDVSPEKSVVVEDSLAGVKAGKKGGFGWVIGVARNKGDDLSLKEHGADQVVSDLGELMNEKEGSFGERPIDKLPKAMKHLSQISKRMSNKKLAIFLDYDGTLTPIVQRPEDAILSSSMRNTVKDLSHIFPVAVISGRDRKDVKNLVGLDEITYAGSHGFDIKGPELQYEHGQEFLSVLDEAESYLNKKINAIKGSFVERKKYSLAVHFRQVDEGDIPKVKQAVQQAGRKFSRLRMSSGKKVFDIRPQIDWDKGKALLWLLKKMGLDQSHVLPLYIGDDTTDEDAFRVLSSIGIGIVVGDDSRPTSAHFRLNNPQEVKTFFKHLISREKEQRS
ncbi:MAG: trehalose-phosphatase [Candidatus Aminicenantes bacterium]|nr:trehalose-phosphatase [Candidatus Aminicenantes bacterium]